MKKYMIRCDMEGVSGIVAYQQAEPGNDEYAYGRKMFMSDLTALLEGLNEGGADEIVIYDEHFYGRNIDMKKLPANTVAICGKPPYRKGWPGGLDTTFSGLILLGLHSKFGTPKGLLHHSYELDIQNIDLNGVSVGEIGIETAIAGELGIPLLLVCGDSAAISEAKSLVVGVEGVAVKESLDTGGGLCYPASVTAKKIRAAALKTAREGCGAIPFVINNETAKLSVTLRQGKYLDCIRSHFSQRLSNNDTLCFQEKCVNDAWAEYWQFKLNVSEMMKVEV